MTASNVVALNCQDTTTISTGDYEGTASTSTVTISSGYTCAGCNQWVWGNHSCSMISWYPYYALSPLIPQANEVQELKAWIDGFMDGRKMTERNLQKVRDKLEEFCD